MCRIIPVGARGFEPRTSRTRTVRATKLRYAPNALYDTTDDPFGKLLKEISDVVVRAAQPRELQLEVLWYDPFYPCCSRGLLE